MTPFIVESYKLLDGPPPSFFGPGGYAVRVNAMWIGSLVINLITALLAIHFKQWLDGYTVRESLFYKVSYLFLRISG